MPSMFEPCGLSQMISLRYGTLPIARETGGLRDTVFSYNEFTGEGNGFTFLNYNAHDMLHVIERAIAVYRDQPDVWKMLAKRAMMGNYGWDQSAKRYVELYRELAQPEEAEKPIRKPRAKKAVPERQPAPEPVPEPKPARKPRAKKAVPEQQPAPEPAPVEKPKRKPRAKKAAPEQKPEV